MLESWGAVYGLVFGLAGYGMFWVVGLMGCVMRPSRTVYVVPQPRPALDSGGSSKSVARSQRPLHLPDF